MTSKAADFPDYSSRDYWNKRYRDGPEAYEWYCDWETAKPVLEKHIEVADRILIVGCGTSMFPADMFDAGYKKMACVDFSTTAVDFQKEVNSGRKIKIFCADVTTADPSDYGGTDYDVVLDKAFLDSLLTGDPGYTRARRTLRRLRAALAPTGVFVTITNAAQHANTRSHHMAILARSNGKDWTTNVRKGTIHQAVCNGDDPPTKAYHVYVLERAEGDEPMTAAVDDVEALAEDDDFFAKWERDLAVDVPQKWKDRGDASILDAVIAPTQARPPSDDGAKSRNDEATPAPAPAPAPPKSTFAVAGTDSSSSESESDSDSD